MSVSNDKPVFEQTTKQPARAVAIECSWGAQYTEYRCITLAHKHLHMHTHTHIYTNSVVQPIEAIHNEELLFGGRNVGSSRVGASLFGFPFRAYLVEESSCFTVMHTHP